VPVDQITVLAVNGFFPVECSGEKQSAWPKTSKTS